MVTRVLCVDPSTVGKAHPLDREGMEAKDSSRAVAVSMPLPEGDSVGLGAAVVSIGWASEFDDCIVTLIVLRLCLRAKKEGAKCVSDHHR